MVCYRFNTAVGQMPMVGDKNTFVKQWNIYVNHVKKYN